MLATVLALDTATAWTSVGAARDGTVLAERETGPGGSGRPRHASALVGELTAAVEAAGGWEAIGRIAVGTGPGTFTGLRIGVAAARAVALARELPLCGVPTLEVIATGIDADGPRLAVIDAKRDEAFAALYDAQGRELWAPFVAPPGELADRVRELGAPVTAAGDGSVRFRAELEGAGALVPGDGEAVHRPRARHLCRLAAGREAGPPEGVEPLYLRRPDAELWRERDRGRNQGA